MGHTFFFQWEIDLIAFLQQFLSDPLIEAINHFSGLADTYVMLGLLLFFYLGVDKEAGKRLGINVLYAILTNTLIKNIFDRRRPYLDSDEVDLLRKISKSADANDIKAQGFSFPSGHSTIVTTLYGSIAYIYKKKIFWIITIVFSLMVGFSRIVVGAHFPTDVVVGWLLGLAIINLMELMRKKITKRWMFNLIIVGSASVGLFYCESDDYFTSYGLLTGTILALYFEEKYVNFENTTNIIRIILRIAGAGLVFVIIEFPIKALAGLSVFDSTFWECAFRVLRYFLISFCALGIYPMLFKYTAKIGKPKAVVSETAVSEETLSEETLSEAEISEE